MDPIDEYGDDSGVLTLPHFGIVIQYTNGIVNQSAKSLVSPDIVVAPTLNDLEAGSDPVLAAALRYGHG
jgi:hypothetical protein